MIKIKLTFDELKLLFLSFYTWKIDLVIGDHGALLIEHCYYFLTILDKKISQYKKNYTLNFNSLDSLAFLQMWMHRALPSSPDQATIVLFIIGKIDQYHKSLKQIAE